MVKSESDPKESEVANICLTENSDLEEDVDEVNELPISCDKLSNAFDILVEDSKRVLKKYHDLRRAHLKLLKDFETIVSEKKYFEKKILSK